MNCAKVRALLDLHLEGRLPQAQSGAIAEHLKTCAECSRLARSLRPAKATPAAMPAEMKEKLRAALLKSAAVSESPRLLEKEPLSALSFASAALVMLATSLPIAALVGAWDPQAGLGAALEAGALVAAGALAVHGLLTGRWLAPRRHVAALALAALAALWQVVAGALGPAFELPAALARVAGPVLFFVAAFTFGGADEARKLLKALAVAAVALVAAAILSHGRVPPPGPASPFDATGAALTALLALVTLAEAVRAVRDFSRRGARAERVLLLALSGASAACAAASFWLLPPAFAALAWISAGAAFGLTSLAGSGEPFAAAAMPLDRTSRRALAGTFAAALALLAIFPARWLADDYRVAGAQRLAALAGSENEALARVDGVWKTSPSWPAAQLLAGDVLLAQGRASEALARLSPLEGSARDYPGLAYREGLAYGKLGDWKQALDCHQRERVLQPAFAPNLERLSVAAKMTGDFELARETALTVISLEPKDPAHWLELSDIALRQALAEKAARRGQRHVRRPRSKKRPEEL